METTILIAVLVLFNVFLLGMNAYDRKGAQDREQSLIAGLLAQNLGEYALANAEFKLSTKQRISKIKAENQLAIDNAKMLEEQEDKKGIPVT